MNEVTNIPLKVTQGCDHRFTFEVSRFTDEPVDFTNAEFVFGARYNLLSEYADIKVKCTIENENIIELRLSHDITAKLKAINEDETYNKLYYDIQMIQNNEVSQIVKGKIFVYPANAHREENNEMSAL